MIAVFDASEQFGVFDGAMGFATALGDDGDFFCGDFEVADDFVIGVLGDSNDASCAAEVQAGKMIEIFAFGSGTIARDGYGVEVVNGYDQWQVAHSEGHVKVEVMIEIGIVADAEEIEVVSQR